MSTNKTDFFQNGQIACRAYYKGQGFKGLTNSIKAEDAMKLYWPPVVESMMMVSTPLPKPRQKWLAGFKKEQSIIIAELQIKCPRCEKEH